MNFYFAAPFEYKDPLIKLTAFIHTLARPTCTVTSTWLFIPSEAEALTGMQAANFAMKDLDDLDRADVCILFNPEGYPQSPGRNIEFGYALAKGKALWIVGRPKGVFQYLPHIKYFKNIEDLMHFFSVWNDSLQHPYLRT